MDLLVIIYSMHILKNCCVWSTYGLNFVCNTIHLTANVSHEVQKNSLLFAMRNGTSWLLCIICSHFVMFVMLLLLALFCNWPMECIYWYVSGNCKPVFLATRVYCQFGACISLCCEYYTYYPRLMWMLIQLFIVFLWCQQVKPVKLMLTLPVIKYARAILWDCALMRCLTIL